MNLIPVEGEKDLFRDPRTNAIINTNQSDYLSYINSRKIRQNEKNKIETDDKRIIDFALSKDRNDFLETYLLPTKIQYSIKCFFRLFLR